MKSVVLISTLSLASAQDYPTFTEWQALHGKNYAPEEAERRSQIYVANIAMIALRNSADTGARYWPDEYADLTLGEWRAARGIVGFGTEPHDGSENQCNFDTPSLGVLTASEVKSLAEGDDIDWRAEGAVTPVKNQGSSGSCGYFSSIAVMEGINVIQGKNELVSLSEQELLDCCTPNFGCNGWPGEEIVWYGHYNKFASTEESYPYHGASSIPMPDGTPCKTGTPTTATSSERVCVPNSDPDVIKANLKTLGPAVWMIDSTCLQFYSGGVISESRCSGSPGTWPHYSGIDHATVMVGTGVDNGTPYYIVKNSWGKSWGEDGYYRVKQDAAGATSPMLNAPGAIFGKFPSSEVV